jgi:transketolase
VAIIASGSRMVWEAVEAAKHLAESGIEARVLDLHTIKPLDSEAIVAAAVATGAIVTVEDHNILGGVGCAVAEVVLSEHPVPVLRVGVPDLFCEEVGPYEEMLPCYRMDAGAIAEAARRAMAKKRAA